MKKILLLLTLINTSAFGADVRIENKDASGDIVFRQKNSVGTMVETMRVSPPLGDGARSVGTVGSIANSQGGLAASDFTSPTNAHWYTLTDLNDGTTGTAKPLTNVGTVPFNRAGFFGRESIASFDGTQSLVSTDAVFNVGNVAFSYGGWFKLDPASTAQALIGRWLSSTGYMLHANTSASSTLYVGASNTPLPAFPRGEWFHVVATYNPTGTLSTVYINGQKTTTLVATNTVSTSSFRVSGYGSTLTDAMKGGGQAQDAFFALETLTADQVNAMYSHRFTNTQQIAAGHVLAASSFPLASLTNKVAFYNLTDLTDGSGNAKTLTNNGTALFTGSDIFGSAIGLTLNGTTQYLSSSDAFFNPGNGHSFGVGGWISSNNWSLVGMLWSNYALDAGDRGWFVYANGTSSIRFVATNSASTFDVDTTAPHSFVNGSWHHVFMYYDYSAQLLKGYIDGALAMSTTLANQRALTTSSFKIGASLTTPANFFNGKIDETVYIKDVQLTDADIRKLYASKTTHSKAISAQNQNWFSSWMREDSKLALPLENGWMTDMNANALFMDFSDLNPGDYVTIKAK